MSLIYHNGFVDAAYKTDYATTVIPIWPRKNFLFINPSSGKPIFEYRGAVSILPGCDVESYSVELVCVTDAEAVANKNKGVSCKSREYCPCLGMTAPTGPPFLVATGGRLSQGQVFDKAISQVPDNTNYVYDHIRVKVAVDKSKHKNCMPAGYEDGVFYFPFQDTSPLSLIGCAVNPTAGTVYCESGLAKELGFGNLQINSIDIPDTTYVGDSLNAKVAITKTGSEDMCLRYYVYKGDKSAGNLKVGPLTQMIIEAYNNQEVILPLFNPIPADVLGGTTQYTRTISGVSETEKNGFSITESIDMGSKPGASLVIRFINKNNNDVIDCTNNEGVKDQYSLNGGEPHDLEGECKITDGSRTVWITKITKESDLDFPRNSGHIERLG